MSTTETSRPIVKILIVAAFAASFVFGAVYLWAQAGSAPPTGRYQVSFEADDVKNLQEGGEVKIAGVVVGHVLKQELGPRGMHVLLGLEQKFAPLHQGATVRVGMKSVVGQAYVDIQDGHGPPITHNTALPKSAVKPAVDIDQLIHTLDPKTREALSASIRSLGGGTVGTAADIDRLVTGLGKLGREGHTALDAIAAQSKDLAALSREGTILFETLDTGQGQIADVVRDSNRLAAATAGQRGAIEDTMHKMPGLLGSARSATGKVHELSGALAPVAADLNRSAPDLNQALVQLPSVSSDLRSLLPALNGVLDQAPATLERVPTFGSDVRRLIPGANLMLRDVNPMLAYLRPYGRDLGVFAANFGASMDLVDHNGVRPVRLAPIFNSGSVRGIPVPFQLDPMHWTNPYPGPGQVGNPTPFTGDYPRVEREPN